MATTILNLDALIPEERSVRYKNAEHILQITSTESYLKVLKARKKLGALAPDDEIGQTELAVDLLVLALPTIPRSDIMHLPLNAMMHLVNIVTGEMDMVDNGADITAEQLARGEMIDVTESADGAGLGESTLALSSPA
jgi:hypothetical protein